MSINKPLISWYLQHARKLPWRETKDPYRIWLSEIILQQTRVDQGMDYYLSFVNTYPNIGFLSQASEAEVLKLWQGLGYYSRARNLHFTAKYIQNELNGQFPENYDLLVKLKGVGPYTAAAIASFAFALPHAVVDGNVARVLSRIFDVEIPVNSTQGAKIINELADTCLDRGQPDTYNQAIMELGAMVCTPLSPGCEQCPLQSQCAAFARGTQTERPVKIKKAKQKLRYIHYAVLENEGCIIFRKREQKDIWQGLNDFYTEEGSSQIDPRLMAEEIETRLEGIHIETLPGNAEYRTTHHLTHQRIEAQFWRFKYKGSVAKKSIYFEVAKNRIDTVAVPRLVHKYLEHMQWLT